MPEPKDAVAEEKSLRDLILGVHAKLDAMRTSYRRIIRDRLRDRDTIQRHGRRIESLELQMAIMVARDPSMKSWRPNPADLTTSEHTAVEIAELDLEDELDPPDPPRE